MREVKTLAPLGYPDRAPCGNPNDWYDPAYVAPEYNAAFLTTPPIPSWADPDDISVDAVKTRITYSGPANGHVGHETTHAQHGTYNSTRTVFLNPKRKTDITVRGVLGKWGPNHAADV